MRTALTTLFAPIFVVVMVGVVLAYPSPTDLWDSMKPLEVQVKPVATGGPSVQKIVTDLSSGLPEDVADRSRENADCFQNLAIADKQKLDRCAGFVYQALIEVEQLANAPVVQKTFETADQRVLVQQLRLAATEVCRIKWAKSQIIGELAIRSPACEVSQVQLASDAE